MERLCEDNSTALRARHPGGHGDPGLRPLRRPKTLTLSLACVSAERAAGWTEDSAGQGLLRSASATMPRAPGAFGCAVAAALIARGGFATSVGGGDGNEAGQGRWWEGGAWRSAYSEIAWTAAGAVYVGQLVELCLRLVDSLAARHQLRRTMRGGAVLTKLALKATNFDEVATIGLCCPERDGSTPNACRHAFRSCSH